MCTSINHAPRHTLSQRLTTTSAASRVRIAIVRASLAMRRALGEPCLMSFEKGYLEEGRPPLRQRV